jgi:hypothetical protein
MASMAVFFSLGAVRRARQSLRSINTAGWGAIDPLRVDPKTVRTVRMIDREAILIRQGREPKDRYFIATGGLSVLIASTVISLALFWWLFGASFLSGGALLPLSASLTELWANTQASGGLPADPFAWVLAVLGTLTFFNPSLIIVVLFAFAIPLAALAAWFWASDITDSPLGRALAAGVWALSPVLLVALSGGRLPTVIIAVTLPWVLLTATRARKSWGWASVTSLLVAVVLASAPSLIPAAIVFFVLGVLGAGAGLARVLLVPLVSVALFAPLAVHAFVNGSPLTLFIDPGLTVNYIPGSQKLGLVDGQHSLMRSESAAYQPPSSPESCSPRLRHSGCSGSTSPAYVKPSPGCCSPDWASSVPSSRQICSSPASAAKQFPCTPVQVCCCTGWVWPRLPRPGLLRFAKLRPQ